MASHQDLLDYQDGLGFLIAWLWVIGSDTWRHLRGSNTNTWLSAGLHPRLLTCRPYGALYGGREMGYAEDWNCTHFLLGYRPAGAHFWGERGDAEEWECTLWLQRFGGLWAGFLLGKFDYTFLLIVRWLWVDFVGKCWGFVGINIGVVGSFVGLFVGGVLGVDGCWMMGGAGFLLGEFDYTFLLIVRWLWVDFVGKCWCFVGISIGVVGSFVGLYVGGLMAAG